MLQNKSWESFTLGGITQGRVLGPLAPFLSASPGSKTVSFHSVSVGNRGFEIPAGRTNARGAASSLRRWQDGWTCFELRGRIMVAFPPMEFLLFLRGFPVGRLTECCGIFGMPGH